MENLPSLIEKEFIKNLVLDKVAEKDEIGVYNEDSVKFELGFFFRKNGYNVQFERNITNYKIKKEKDQKSEVDLIVTDPNSGEKSAIEIKFPRNGEYPNQMKSFCRDIMFLEKLSKTGEFKNNPFMVFVDDDLFWKDANNRKKDGIYSFFRVEKPIPLNELKGIKGIEIKGEYTVNWEYWDSKEECKYWIQPII